MSEVEKSQYQKSLDQVEQKTADYWLMRLEHDTYDLKMKKKENQTTIERVKCWFV